MTISNTFLSTLGITCASDRIHQDLCIARLIELALARHEATLTSTGSLATFTGAYTGRAPKNRFIVDTPDVHDRIAWGHVNAPMTPEKFDVLLEGVATYLSSSDIFVEHCLAGANRAHSRKFTVVAQQATQAMFSYDMLVRPTEEELESYGEPDYVVLAAPGYGVNLETCGAGSEACIAINLSRRIIVVAGSGYSGEIKKAIFSTMNYLLPVEDGVLPMHSSANMDPKTHETAVFFGLSGTGKTTLSADPSRLLIGDDEHGWADDGVFNIEGGCYAKCIDLDAEREPDIFGAIRIGSISENVVIDRTTHVADYTDRRYTENTRAAYPIENIDNALVSGVGGVPTVIIFLTADAFGVLPPLSRLDNHGAMYHFMSGFTSKVAGTEQGIKEPVPTFSALFGEPFMPLDPLEYAEMLSSRIADNNTRCYLVNTGWTGGPYGTGHRMSLRDTRTLVDAALDGSIEQAEFVRDERFNLDVPTSCEGVDSELLIPRNTWDDGAAYDAQADRLAQMFADNFAKRYPNAPDEVRLAGPRVAQ